MLKSFAQSVGPLFDALASAQSEMLVGIRENCRPEKINRTMDLIKQVINEDVTYQKKPLDLRNQRTYAVKVVDLPLYLHNC
jgi:DNA mismatch repair protein MSH4